ncbi:hypothetical protein HAX54_024410, partial [Datura stramonium]|nr:hypothetical protein [Datura stramonium]
PQVKDQEKRIISPRLCLMNEELEACTKATYLNEIKFATKWSFYSKERLLGRKKPLCLKMLGWLDWMAILH